MCVFSFQQVLEETDFKGEDFDLFQVAGQKCLEDGYAAQLLEVIQNDKNKVSLSLHYVLVVH